MSNATATAILPSLSLDALLAQRDACSARLTAIHDATAEIERITQALDATVPDHTGAHYRLAKILSGGRYEGPSLTDDRWLPHATASLDAALWDLLLHRSGLRSFMDAKAREEWDQAIEKLKTPPLTEANITATFAQLHASRSDLFERGVVALFRALSWDFKTNLPHRFGPRIIVRHVLDTWGHVDWRTSNTLDDLLRAFHILDNQPEPDHRLGVANRLRGRVAGEDLIDPYFRVRTFKNGNGHLHFLRQDLVDRLNHILAKHHPNALPPRTT
jgi:hypothetical protein